MIKFQIINNILTLEPKILLIDCFNELNKLEPLNNTYLKYVFFISDITEDNPYANLEDQERLHESKKQCFKDVDKVFDERTTSLINEAFAQYAICNDNSDERLIKTYDTTIDKMRKAMEGCPPEFFQQHNPRTGEIKFVDNFKVHSDALIRIEAIGKAKDALVDRVKNKKAANKTRGQQEIGLNAQGVLKGKEKIKKS